MSVKTELSIYLQENEVMFTSFTKNQTQKLLKENIEKTLPDLGVGKNFLNGTPVTTNSTKNQQTKLH